MGSIAKPVAVLAGAALLFMGYRAMSRPKLTYFTAGEFGIWWPFMSADLLLKLDAFRAVWGAPVMLSPAQGGIGREDDSNSQHNLTRWGEVRAVDVMPYGMDTVTDRLRAVALAEGVGFTGIGVYPNWQPRAGLHLDVRPPQSEGHVAKWSQLASGAPYVSINEGIYYV